ncbi:MX dynamin-like GTPase 1 L homeolog isoform X1 [Xenopus laevis]|uniref:Uncharacterized protein n=2 Tax=Xenopus laevis TaxID=8355 RepID=A0A974DLU1_XENLA|nr:MX dynamin-like GTPase 1 L homeolog isoform X1 [Xenopus laevis]OCT93745.1 hypothetical protein XELAEV_18011415mg [Xenopus laevis]
MENIMSSQYEEKIRPCIDLIDSLRALGVDKDLGLPSIAVIGDQSSGKSSVLEALSGVTLPRGSGIVTRCPLELKLKKATKSTTWSGKISYRDHELTIASAAEVENQVKQAQNLMAGNGKGISDELISLEVISPDVPDLTLIDLPGITRVALPDQPKDIGQQIKKMIRKYIQRQETINLVVVPSNVDIATTEALEMAREVDPNGERTLGILTKPDLVDRGAESDVVSVVRNLVYSLQKGYMIVKCRGQLEIQENLSLKEALDNEQNFFKEHEHFSVLLEEGNATIACLAEKLTNELVDHIVKTLPALDTQIRKKLNEAEEKLRNLGTSVPDSETEKLRFLIDKITRFAGAIINATQGDEEMTNGSLKLFTVIRKHFYFWESFIQKQSKSFQDKSKDDISEFENKYRGRELPGFISFKVFENIARGQIRCLEEPAMEKLKEVTEIVKAHFNQIAMKHFLAFPNLYRGAKVRIEDICHKQVWEAERTIRTQFKMEKIIYCQDRLYSGRLNEVRSADAKPTNPIFHSIQTPAPTPMQISCDEMHYHVQAYFKSLKERLSNQIPMIIQYYILHEFSEKLQNQMMQLIQEREKLNTLLAEKTDITRVRDNLSNRIERLTAASHKLAKFHC